MYTVAELIETLKQCPQDYTVYFNHDGDYFAIECVGINNEEETVDFFTDY